MNNTNSSLKVDSLKSNSLNNEIKSRRSQIEQIEKRIFDKEKYLDNKDSVLFTDKGVPHAYVPGHDANMLFMQTNSSGDWAMGDYWGPISNETRGWLDHLSTGKQCNHTTAKEGRQTLAVTIAIEESSRTGQTIKLNS